MEIKAENIDSERRPVYENWKEGEHLTFTLSIDRDGYMRLDLTEKPESMNMDGRGFWGGYDEQLSMLFTAYANTWRDTVFPEEFYGKYNSEFLKKMHHYAIRFDRWDDTPRAVEFHCNIHIQAKDKEGKEHVYTYVRNMKDILPKTYAAKVVGSDIVHYMSWLYNYIYTDRGRIFREIADSKIVDAEEKENVLNGGIITGVDIRPGGYCSRKDKNYIDIIPEKGELRL